MKTYEIIKMIIESQRINEQKQAELIAAYRDGKINAYEIIKMLKY